MLEIILGVSFFSLSYYLLSLCNNKYKITNKIKNSKFKVLNNIIVILLVGIIAGWSTYFIKNSIIVSSLILGVGFSLVRFYIKG